MTSMEQSYWNLPDDVSVNILSRLPAKSVGLCRCVSKSWQALLTQPDFIRAHLHVSTTSGQESLTFFGNRLGLLIAHLRDAQHLSDKVTLSPTAVDFSFDGRPCVWGMVYASCNGLVLAATFELIKIYLFVLNPITKELRQLPPLPYRRGDVSCFVGIRGGIGYDSMNDDYKVVDISYHHYRDRKTKSRRIRTFIDIYSLKTGSWKRPVSFPYNPPYNVSGSGVYVGGCIHWLAINYIDNRPALVAFDLGEETFHEMPPPCLIESDTIPYFWLIILDGLLCLFHAIENYAWVMKEYGVHDSWMKFTLDNPPWIGEVWGSPSYRCGEIRILGSMGHGEVVLWVDKNKLVVYNVKEGTFKDIVAMASISDRSTVNFVESLVSPVAWW